MTAQPLYTEFQVTALPAAPLLPSAVYYVKAVGAPAIQVFVTDLNGNPFPLATDTSAQLAAGAARDAAIQSATYAQAQAQAASFAATQVNAALANIQVQGAVASPFSHLLDDISGLFDGVRTVFNLTFLGSAVSPIASAQLIVVLAGSFLTPGAEYSISGSQITYQFAPAAGFKSAILELQATTTALSATSAAASAASATAASSSATAASGSATASSGSAAAGATSAASAAASAATATTQAANAAASAAQAASAVTGVVSFNGRQGAVVATVDILDSIAGLFDNATAVFSLKKSGVNYTPVNAGYLTVTLGGARQTPLIDYTTSGTNLTFIAIPPSGMLCSIVATTL